MTIRLDASDRTVVAVCEHPGCSWRVVRLDRLGANRAAATHDRAAHDSEKASAALAAAMKRRALQSKQ